MAVIRNAQAGQLARDAIVLDFGDLARQGELMRAQALKTANQVVSDAQAERKTLLEHAKREGYAVGHAEGLKAGLAAGRAEGLQRAMAERAAELRKLETAWQEALGRVERERAAGLESLRTDGIRLAIEIAERIVQGAIAIDPKRIVAIAESAIAAAAGGSDLRVMHAPQDHGVLAEAMPGLIARFAGARRIELVEDAALPAGSVVVRSGGGGGVDASLCTQLERIRDALLPDAAREPGADRGAQA